MTRIMRPFASLGMTKLAALLARTQLRHPLRQPLPRPADHRRAVAPQEIEIRVPQLGVLVHPPRARRGARIEQRLQALPRPDPEQAVRGPDRIALGQAEAVGRRVDLRSSGTSDGSVK